MEFKIICAGEEDIGKTTFLMQFFRGKFYMELEDTYQGVNLFRKDINFPNLSEQDLILNIWDIAGNKRFINYFPIFSKGIDCVIVIIGQNNFLHTTEEWISHINKFFSIKTPRFLVILNKIGEEVSEIEDEMINETKTRFDFKSVSLIDSKDDDTVNEFFKIVCQTLVDGSNGK